MRHREAPLAEVTLRKYEKPYRLEGRELIKKLCLSVGLLQPGDSRDVLVDVFQALLQSPEPVSMAVIESEVRKSRRRHKLPMRGMASSNIRRQVRRLKELFLVERVGRKYRLMEDAPLHEVFVEKIEKLYVPSIISRVKEYCEAVEKGRWKNELSKVRQRDDEGHAAD